MIDFEKLAVEAAVEAAELYPRRALRCWPWSHRWTMWRECRDPDYPATFAAQRRHCLRCGRIRVERFAG